MTLLSEIYDVTLKRDNRGAAKGGFVRPTIGEHFMTHMDFNNVSKGYIAKSVIFDINSRYGGLNYGIRTIEFYNNEEQIELITNYAAYHSTTLSSAYDAEFVFNSNSNKLGQAFNNGWASVKTSAPQRLVIVFNDVMTFDKVVVNNYHNYGDLSELSLKNVKITITTDIITSTTPNTSIQNGAVIFNSVFEQHTAVDEIQDWEVPLL